MPKEVVSMGKNLADFIERFILNKFINNQNEYILMRRNDLATELSCAPSQISYVLSTRFTPERGFVVESRRGAGGFVRIVRVKDKANKGKKVNVSTEQIIKELLISGAISKREYCLLKCLSDVHNKILSEEDKVSMLQDVLRRMEDA